MEGNVLAQSDSKIFESAMFLEQNVEVAWLFACWQKFKKEMIQHFLVCVANKGHGHRTQHARTNVAT